MHTVFARPAPIAHPPIAHLLTVETTAVLITIFNYSRSSYYSTMFGRFNVDEDDV